MIREIEHSVQARTNPIFLTGKTAACLMADAGITDAVREILETTGFDQVLQ